MPWTVPPRILAEHLVPVPEPLAVLLQPGAAATPEAVARRAARALLELPETAGGAWPPWLAPHQVPAAERLAGIVARYGGALLADAVGLGKSYVALAVALAQGAPITLVVPAVLVPQWRALLARFGTSATVITHEALSSPPVRPSARPPQFFVVDEAHRFRNPDTKRYRALAKLVVGSRVLLVTATPVHNRLADLFHLFRLFLRDHALTALGVPSLARAARGEVGAETAPAVAARLTVARSRERVRRAYTGGAVALAFPDRAPGETIRAGTVPEPLVAELAQGIRGLSAGGAAAPLVRLTLLRRLASSLPALRASLARHESFLALALEAARHGRTLGAREFARLFPPAETADVQLALLPLLLAPGACDASREDLEATGRLRGLADSSDDPKAAALERLLAERADKTIVFVDARATVRHLLRLLRSRHRVAAVLGEGGLFGLERAGRAEVLGAFAPTAQGGARPPAFLETDLLIATDLLSEGLNLQDAARVVHYDLPWSPARLAQRVGRIDRLGSAHERIETVTFLPPVHLEQALAIEARLAAKARAQVAAGAAQVETVAGAWRNPPGGGLDWGDRLDALRRGPSATGPEGAWCAVPGAEDAAVLVVRIGALVEALVATEAGVRADPDAATRLLERAARQEARPAERGTVERAIRRAAPLVRARLAAIEDARWRAGDRDRLSRRLIPWVLGAARRAARRGDARQLAALDALVSRLASGMTAGEELLLEDLLGRRTPLGIRDLLAWHGRLPPVSATDEAPGAELVAAVVVQAADEES